MKGDKDKSNNSDKSNEQVSLNRQQPPKNIKNVTSPSKPPPKPKP